MRKYVFAVACIMMAACSGRVDSSCIPEAGPQEIVRVEPLSWWTGMKTSLQLLVQGPEISAFDVAVTGSGLKVKAVHKAQNPDFVFVDVEVSPKAAPGTYDLVFSRDGESFKYPYLIRERRPGSATRESFTTADMMYLIMPDRFARGEVQERAYEDGSGHPWQVPLMLDREDRKDPNARHGGNIQGIVDHLDYVEDLGATALWLTPALINNQPRGTYHGYAISDYYH
ncbi:MAG: cyclomaltodextrinase N-terminal domain-containing protein, partial [Bacteroidales bacterium]|nr:cyclomaltodextrinase N-terminal domain-containing protein [Bacteroidales bacterium]